MCCLFFSLHLLVQLSTNITDFKQIWQYLNDLYFSVRDLLSLKNSFIPAQVTIIHHPTTENTANVLLIHKILSKKKSWTIPDKIAPFVGQKIPNGFFLEFRLYTSWDDEGSTYSHDKMQNSYWIDYFTNHIKSAWHKKKLAKKLPSKCMSAEQNGGNRELPLRRKKQPVLLFAESSPSSQQIRERKIGSVCPSFAYGSSASARATSKPSSTDC